MKRAFTLAEVLITLGIIGIVAAMTLPMLIANYQKKETVERLKKVYNNLLQAIIMSEADNESIEYWDFTLNSADFFTKYLQKYMPNILNIRYSDIMNEVKYKRPNGTVESSFTLLAGSALVVSLKDGSLLYWNQTIYNHKTVCVDLNGLKKPNIIGRDFFCFSIVNNNSKKFVPYGAYGSSDMPMDDMTRESAKKGSYACSRSGRGQFCSALIMLDGWKIKDDYPW